jgi:hypothetical protein
MKERKQPSFEPYDEKENPEPYVFISYSHLDEEVIDDLEQLSKLGFRIWYDEGILASVDWGLSIDEHIKACSVLVIFVSDNAIKSRYAVSEVEEATDKNIPVLPVFLYKEEDPGVQYRALLKLQGIMRWEYSNRMNDYYDELCKKLEGIASHTRADAYERDSKTLGLGYLPTLYDILRQGKTSLSPEEQEQRRKRLIGEMRKADPPIKSYHIDNVFQITSEATHALHNLGKFELYKTDPERPTNLLTLPLHIEQVYVTPLRLVTGLITRLDENWPPLVASYSDLVKKDQMNQLADLHYYIEFCWLAWGPSVLTTSLFVQNQEFMVVQAAFGDEANSLPLLMKKAKWGLIEDKLGSLYSGWPLSLKNVLVVRPGADDFFKAVRNYPLFKDVFSDKSQVALYLPHEDKEYANGEIKTLTEAKEAFYSTAYVWLMLEQIEQDEVESENIRYNKMEPGNVIPFFEHANLATSKGLNFLQHCLARKAIYHVLDCESDPDYRDKGYYRFATALFPEQMIEILEKEISRLNMKDQDTLKKRFKIPKNPKDWRTPVEVVEFADAVAEAIEKCCEVLVKDSGTATGN